MTVVPPDELRQLREDQHELRMIRLRQDAQKRAVERAQAGAGSAAKEAKGIIKGGQTGDRAGDSLKWTRRCPMRRVWDVCSCRRARRPRRSHEAPVHPPAQRLPGDGAHERTRLADAGPLGAARGVVRQRSTVAADQDAGKTNWDSFDSSGRPVY